MSSTQLYILQPFPMPLCRVLKGTAVLLLRKTHLPTLKPKGAVKFVLRALVVRPQPLSTQGARADGSEAPGLPRWSAFLAQHFRFLT